MRRLEPAARCAGGIPAGRLAPGALRAAFRRDRDQLVVPPAAPRVRLAALGRSVPDSFRFCAKLPKAITHERRLADADPALDGFLAQAQPLGEKLACLLVQLPPSLAFDAATARDFLQSLRLRWQRDVALEPRHASWFALEPDALLASHRVARVLADPVRFAQAAAPGGWAPLVYLRLHGSPRMYYSAYAPPVIEALAHRIAMELHAGRTVWCTFDNTASGAAVHDALALQAALRGLT